MTADDVLFGVDAEVRATDAGFLRVYITDLASSGVTMSIRVPLATDPMSVIAALSEGLPRMVEDSVAELVERMGESGKA